MRYNVKKTLLKESKEEMFPNVLVAGELESFKRFNKKYYLDFISKIQKEFIKEQKSLNFYIYGDKKSVDFVNIIKNSLAKQKLNVVNKKRKNSIIVRLKTIDNIGNKICRGIAVLKLNIKVLDNSQQIGGKSFVLKERCNGLKSSAYKNASIHFKQDINSQGIGDILGIEVK